MYNSATKILPRKLAWTRSLNFILQSEWYPDVSSYLKSIDRVHLVVSIWIGQKNEGPRLWEMEVQDT